MVKVQPSVNSIKEFQTVAAAVKLAGRDTRKRINQATRDKLNAPWKSLIEERATLAMDRKVLVPGARIAGGNPPVAVAGTSNRKPHDGRYKLSDLTRGREFGAHTQGEYRRYNRRGPGKGTSVERRTARQMPAVNRSGRVVYAAFAELAPRAVTLWTKIVVKSVMDAFEGK